MMSVVLLRRSWRALCQNRFNLNIQYHLLSVSAHESEHDSKVNIYSLISKSIICCPWYIAPSCSLCQWYFSPVCNHEIYYLFNSFLLSSQANLFTLTLDQTRDCQITGPQSQASWRCWQLWWEVCTEVCQGKCNKYMCRGILSVLSNRLDWS